MESERQYALTLEMLLQVLQAHASQECYQVYTAAQAEFFSAFKGKAPRGTRCQVTLLLDRGQVIFCAIQDQQGNELLTGEQALQSVWLCDPLVWTVQPQKASESAPDFSMPYNKWHRPFLTFHPIHGSHSC